MITDVASGGAGVVVDVVEGVVVGVSGLLDTVVSCRMSKIFSMTPLAGGSVVADVVETDVSVVVGDD